MCSSLASFSLCLPSKIPFLLNRGFISSSWGNPLHIRARNPSRYSISASTAESDLALDLAWISWDKVASDDFNGWDIEEEDNPKLVKKKGLNVFAVIGFGASAVGIIGLLAYFALSSKGIRLRSPWNGFHGFSEPSYSSDKDDSRSETRPDVPLKATDVPTENLDDAPEASVMTEKIFEAEKEQKFEHILVSFVVDSAQQEAFLALQKLKIIEDDASASELCTRREYARWLVRANSHLERSRKHRINSPAALSGSIIAAFDDVPADDPDFEAIQSLAEAGIVRSKLSNGNSGSSLDKVEEPAHFSPERFISRQDLVCWKAKIEYEVPEVDGKMSRRNIGFLDVKEIPVDILPDLYMDIRADEKSVIRAVFGQSKRLQPSKPCTKAQAAVALTSGRMSEFIQAEISRLEAEIIARQSELKELRSELLERGDIREYWEGKIEEERNRGVKVEADYISAVSALEEAKMFQENAAVEFAREKAALNCQEKLLLNLKGEVESLSEKLSSESAEHIDEQREVSSTRHDLQANYAKLIDTKSILEAEIEAMRMLRTWMEKEAKNSQARAKVLEEAGRRWKWDG
ncbi:uncharacterized protein LOC127264080 [Andrographis paniculata]|uniref:uncharacterized protein LOC127264080 n=1 Tax=Andrographis paniculata TaxID=175694 RepID=UPI0021E8B104|nr:uncharacterized protein LOC127264080 [Andrographis paniculata]